MGEVELCLSVSLQICGRRTGRDETAKSSFKIQSAKEQQHARGSRAQCFIRQVVHRMYHIHPYGQYFGKIAHMACFSYCLHQQEIIRSNSRIPNVCNDGRGWKSHMPYMQCFHHGIYNKTGIVNSSDAKRSAVFRRSSL